MRITSPMMTEGKRAVALYEVNFSFSAILTDFICLTNSCEFLQTRGFFLMIGFNMLLRKEAKFSCGAPRWEVMRRAG